MRCLNPGGPLSKYCENGFLPTMASMKLKRPRAPFFNEPWCPWIRIHGERIGYLYDNEYIAPKPQFSSELMTKIKHAFSKAGFYHDIYIRKPWNFLWKVIVKQSGMPPLNVNTEQRIPVTIEKIATDLLIIGNEPSAIIVANEAASRRSLSSLLIIDKKPNTSNQNTDNMAKLDSEVYVLENTNYLGRFEDGYLAVNRNKRVTYIIEAKTILFSTGTRETFPIFENNDLPGIISSDLAEELVEYGCIKGKETITLLARGGKWKRTAEKLIKINPETRIFYFGKMPKDVQIEVTNINIGSEVIAKGYPKVNNIIIADKSAKHTVPTDIVVIAMHRQPNIEPLLQHGLEPAYSESLESITVNTLPGGKTGIEGVYALGEVTGTSENDLLEEAMIASDIIINKKIPNESEKYRLEEIQKNKGLVAFKEKIIENKPPFMLTTSIKGMKFVCTCEDLTLEDIVISYERGFTTLEKIKRYSALGTGSCQGRLCQYNVAILLSYLKRVPLGSLGLIRQRPPLQPLEMKYLDQAL